MESSTEEELKTRIRQQEVVTDLGQRALSTDDLDELMHEVTAAVAETLDTDYSYILELQPDSSEFILRQGVGWQEGTVGNATVPTERDSQAGYTLLSKEPVIVDDLREEDRFTGNELLVDHGVISGITVLIGTIDAPWGVLGAFATDRREFTEQDVTFIQSIANLVASAIENERAESELEEMYGRISDAFFALDENWRFAYINERADEVINPEGRDLIGKNVWEEFPKAIERSFKPKYEQAMYEQETVSFEEYYPEPLDAWFEVRAYPSETGLSVYFRDVTERKAIERRLRERERQLSTLIDNVPGMVYRCKNEPGWPMKFVSDACQGITGYISESLENGEVSWGGDIMVQDDREMVWETVQQETAENQTFSETYRIETADGEQRWVRDYGRGVFDEHGTLVEIEGIISDITEQKRMERKLEESNERLEQFAYAASHDLQEPLRMVSTYLELIERRYGDALDEDGEAFLEFAVDGAERMKGMIEGLLEYSRVESEGDPFTLVDLEAVLEDVLADLQFRIGETNADITAESLPRVKGDGNQLRQVFQNLISNAIEYSGDAPPRIHITAEQRGPEWLVSVRDEGIGIDPEDADRVFEVFQRLHTQEEHPGIGIGLALSKKIVERHGGDIWVDSEPGEGATFSFTLPAATKS